MNFIQKMFFKYKADREGKKRFQEFLKENKELMAKPISQLKFKETNYVFGNAECEMYNFGKFKISHPGTAVQMRAEKQGQFEKTVKDRYKTLPGRHPFVIDILDMPYEGTFKMDIDYTGLKRPAVFTLQDLMMPQGKIEKKGQSPIVMHGYSLSNENTYRIIPLFDPYQKADNSSFIYKELKTERVTSRAELQRIADNDAVKVDCYYASGSSMTESLNNKNIHIVKDLLISQEWQKSLHMLDVNAVNTALLNDSIDMNVLANFKQQAYTDLTYKYNRDKNQAEAAKQAKITRQKSDTTLHA